MKNRRIEILAILYILIWTIAPPLQVGMIYRLAALGCAGLLAVMNGFSFDIKKHGYPLLFIILVALTAILMNFQLSAALGQIAVYLLFLGYLMNSWYEEDWQSFRLIIPILLVLLAFWNYRSVVVLAADPSASRAVVRDDERALHYLQMGVGGYGLTYAQVIIVPAILSWILRAFKRNKLYFIIGVVWAVSFIRYLSLAGYSIAIVASVVGILIYFIYRKEKAAPALLISLLFVVALVLMIAYNESFRNWLLRIFDGTKVAYKIRDITTTVATDETADSIYERIKRYRASLETMLKYPIIGGWRVGGGGHSALLDTFAQYGLFGGWMYTKMLYCVPMSWKKEDISPVTMRTINATIVSMTFVALLDSLPYNVVLMPTVVLPIILSDLEDDEMMA